MGSDLDIRGFSTLNERKVFFLEAFKNKAPTLKRKIEGITFATGCASGAGLWGLEFGSNGRVIARHVCLRVWLKSRTARRQTGRAANGGVGEPAHTETGIPEGIPTTAAHGRCNGLDKKRPPDGGCPPYVFQVAKPGRVFIYDIARIRCVVEKRQEAQCKELGAFFDGTQKGARRMSKGVEGKKRSLR
ncbi:hypothetical protein NX784_17545 [Massilia pinisoli]|uniref:Uncharacterized protein n=1 Tax=Massilia pinisoli TaxID=1772194 RepID=A0ABT1ZTY9_9BURK|nr:hypothetical protein [Massilia pinisoli]MCS0583398.1 hypothetical protein [Massilia pinisoli]